MSIDYASFDSYATSGAATSFTHNALDGDRHWRRHFHAALPVIRFLGHQFISIQLLGDIAHGMAHARQVAGMLSPVSNASHD